ncbi:MAG TPA: right-handed parallel beta-helix repeat-containing protein [Terracidiphilus sp.]|nr:right-handed parallel beta-helix repeat-containing protein [Terracidiphilus sp.]
MRVFPGSVQFLFLVAAVAVASTVFSAPSSAATLCVNPTASNGCYSSIQSAVNHAAARDVIVVRPGTYKEGVVIGIPLSLLGTGAGQSTIDATNQPNGVLVDGYNHHGLHDVVVAGFTVENAEFEGILAVSATSVTIANNTVKNNDKSPGLLFTGEATGCPGQPAYETDETGDCGGAIHLIGVSWSTVSANLVTGNADGLLISDETAISQGNEVNRNTFLNNPLECGIVLASHPPVGSSGPYFATHYGVVGNTVTNNDSEGNGVAIGGAGVGLFSDGNGPGRVSENVVSHNRLVGNGLGGVTLHTHVGPAFGAPADDMDNNTITGNFISGNLADSFDTVTPGRVGININSGGGGSPVRGTLIATNVITDEDVDIAVNTPAKVEIHTNDLLGGKIGVANICAFDKASGFAPTAVCTGAVYAAQNYWGCSAGPDGGPPCSSVPAAYGTNVIDTPWLSHSVANGHDEY